MSVSTVYPSDLLSPQPPMSRSSEVLMRKSDGKSDKPAGKSDKFVGDFDTYDGQWRAFFSALHPLKTAQCIAARIGAPERTVERWLDGTATPALKWFFRLAEAYGPEFLAACMPGCAWLSAVARETRRVRLDAELTRLEGELQSLMGD
jgi:hypothetical protein